MKWTLVTAPPSFTKEKTESLENEMTFESNDGNLRQRKTQQTFSFSKFYDRI